MPEASVHPVPPFDFAKTLTALDRFPSSPDTRRFHPGGFRQGYRVGGRVVVVRVDGVGSVAAPELRIGWRDDLADDDRAALLGAIRAHLGLDDDLRPFYAVAERDPLFAPVLEALWGFHLLRYPTVFEAACWALVQQRTPNRFAYATMSRLQALLGDDGEGPDGARYEVFPAPNGFVTGAREALLEATNNTRKTDRLVPLGEAFATVDEGFLQTAPWDEVARWLKRIHGVGAWSVDYVMLRGLGRGERTPWTDTGLIEAVSRVYTPGLSIARGSLRELAEGYGWFQGWWVHYLKRWAFDPVWRGDDAD